MSGLSMHGTGTPLGDPIEVSAATAVFRPLNGAQTSQPLGLLASKSSVGHGEPAAGMLGMAFATASLQHRAAAPLLHLRSLNPHVQSVLVARLAGGAGEGSTAGLVIARVAAPVSLQTCVPPAYSVSSFAFQVIADVNKASTTRPPHQHS